MNKEKRIMEIIGDKRSEMVAFLKQLISFDSTITDGGLGGKEGKAQKWLASELQKMGFEVDVFEPDPQRIEKFKQDNNYLEDRDIPSMMDHKYIDRPNVVGVMRGKGNGKSLIINGHMDTVETGPKALWKYDPFSGYIENGKIYGVGASDMKGGLAAAIMAIKSLKEAEVELGGDVIVESVVAEEIGGYGTAACLEKGYTADGAIVAEPTQLNICVKQRGVLFLEIKVKGKSIHGSVKWKGVNAIEKMMKIIKSLKELESIWTATIKDPMLPDQSISFGQIEGGVGESIVPQQCVLRLMIEYLPSSIDKNGFGKKVRKEIEKWILTFCQGDVWLRKNLPKLTWYSSACPFETDPGSSFVKSVKKGVEKVLPNPVVTGFVTESDANYLRLIRNIPTILFGPGNIENCHRIDEYLDINEYILGIKAFASILLEWCS